MAFGIGMNTQTADKGTIRGRQEEAACGCWFTSTGRAIPKLVKYQDSEGILHCISDIEVLYSEKQNFCGIPMISYRCRAADGGKEYHFTLLFHLEDSRWNIIWES